MGDQNQWMEAHAVSHTNKNARTHVCVCVLNNVNMFIYVCVHVSILHTGLGVGNH